jgi:uncharacterized protein YbjQ (UPF0145 family)
MTDVLLYSTDTVPACHITGSWGVYYVKSYSPLDEVLKEVKDGVAEWGAQAVVGLRIEPIEFVSGGNVGVGTNVGYLVYGTPVTYEGGA